MSDAFLAPFLVGGALEASARAEMTFPNVVNDLLMLAPSFRRAPVAPVELALSLPARSTRLGRIRSEIGLLLVQLASMVLQHT